MSNLNFDQQAAIFDSGAAFDSTTGVGGLNYGSTQSATSGFDIGNIDMGSIGSVLNAASAIGGYFNAKDANKQARKEFEYNKSMRDKEYAMAKDAYDRNTKRADYIGNQMRAESVKPTSAFAGGNPSTPSSVPAQSRKPSQELRNDKVTSAFTQ